MPELNENERQRLREISAEWQELSAEALRRGFLSPEGREATLQLFDAIVHCNSIEELAALKEMLEIKIVR
jgi:hypothetical protein